MPFGKYKDELVGDTPASYLLWFADQMWAGDWPELLAYVNKNKKFLIAEKENIEEVGEEDESGFGDKEFW